MAKKKAATMKAGKGKAKAGKGKGKMPAAFMKAKGKSAGCSDPDDD
jgi:hypothetical protein